MIRAPFLPLLAGGSRWAPARDGFGLPGFHLWWITTCQTLVRRAGDVSDVVVLGLCLSNMIPLEAGRPDMIVTWWLWTLWTTNDAFWVGSGHIPPYSTYAGVAEIVKLATSWNTMVQSVNCQVKLETNGICTLFPIVFALLQGWKMCYRMVFAPFVREMDP